MASRALELVLLGKDKGALSMLGQLGTKSEQTEKKVNKFGGASSVAFAGAATAAAAFAMKSVGALNNVGGEVLKLQRYTGDTAEASSRLRFAAQQTGTDVDLLAKSLGIASKNLVKSVDPMKDFGIQTRTAKGEMRPMTDLLLDAADKFSKMPNGAEKSAAAMKLFGKSGMEMIPFLNRGKEGLEELMARADEFGLVLDGPALDAIKKNKQAQRELTAAMEGLHVKVGSAVIPIMTKFAGVLSQIPGPIADIIGPVVGVGGALMGVAFVGQKLSGTVGPLVGKLQGLNAAGAQSATVFKSAGGAIGAGASTVALAAVAYGMWTQRMDEAAASAKKLSDIAANKRMNIGSMDELSEHTAKVKRETEGLNAELAESSGAWEMAGMAIGPVMALLGKDPFEGGNPVDADHRIELKKYRDALEAAAFANVALEVRVREFAAANNVSTEEARGAVVAADKQTKAHEELAKAVGETEAAIQEQQEALRASLDPMFAAATGIRNQAEAQREATVAGQEVAEAQRKYNEQAAIWGAQSPQAREAWATLTEATRAKSEADRAQVDAAYAMELAQIRIREELKAGKPIYSESIAKLNEWRIAGIITAAQAGAMGVEFYRAAVQANGLLWASKQVDAAYASGGRTIGGTIKQGPPPAFAAGGSVSDGWFTVGERGPELGRKSGSSVQIFSNAQSGQMAGNNMAGARSFIDQFNPDRVGGSDATRMANRLRNMKRGVVLEDQRHRADVLRRMRDSASARSSSGGSASSSGGSGGVVINVHIGGSVIGLSDITSKIESALRQANRTRTTPILSGLG